MQYNPLPGHRSCKYSLRPFCPENAHLTHIFSLCQKCKDVTFERGWGYDTISMAFQKLSKTFWNGETITSYSGVGGLGCSKVYSLICGLQMTPPPCFSILSVYIPTLSLFFSNPSIRGTDQRREGKMDQGILCPRPTSVPQSHTVKESGTRGHSLLAQTQSHGWQNIGKVSLLA